MKLFTKETLILAIAFTIAIAGLFQIFHEEAYAVVICELNCTDIAHNCMGNCRCAADRTVATTCQAWCASPSVCPPDTK